jgi:hypothetical protein
MISVCSCRLTCPIVLYYGRNYKWELTVYKFVVWDCAAKQRMLNQSKSESKQSVVDRMLIHSWGLWIKAKAFQILILDMEVQ